jgi:hypothetical protein
MLKFQKIFAVCGIKLYPNNNQLKVGFWSCGKAIAEPRVTVWIREQKVFESYQFPLLKYWQRVGP